MKTEDIRITLSIIMLFIGIEAFILSAPLLLLLLVLLLIAAAAVSPTVLSLTTYFLGIAAAAMLFTLRLPPPVGCFKKLKFVNAANLLACAHS